MGFLDQVKHVTSRLAGPDGARWIETDSHAETTVDVRPRAARLRGSLNQTDSHGNDRWSLQLHIIPTSGLTRRRRGRPQNLPGREAAPALSSSLRALRTDRYLRALTLCFGFPEPFSGCWVGLGGSYLTFFVWGVRLDGRRFPSVGCRGKHRIGLGSESRGRRSAQAGSFGEGAGSSRMSGNGVHVKSHETDVMRDRCASLRGVVRCVSVADTSLSLSLSATGFLAPKTAQVLTI
jgi:hypothetical protein